jgi:hypothetical protein
MTTDERAPAAGAVHHDNINDTTTTTTNTTNNTATADTRATFDYEATLSGVMALANLFSNCVEAFGLIHPSAKWEKTDQLL